MCLAVLGLAAHPAFALIIAANRDEHHARPTAPATWWPEGWFAGRDLQGGGTWLGLHRSGRFALLTNVREPERKQATAPTRGRLVTALLAGTGDAASEVASDVACDAASNIASDVPSGLARIESTMGRYNGFNLLAGTPAVGYWLSNRGGGVRRLTSGTHALSNAGLDTPWPKVLRTREAVADWCARGDDDAEQLFGILGSRTPADDAMLPSTGVSLEWERRLSAPFIVAPGYGTRSSTVVLVTRGGEAIFIERSFDAGGQPAGTVRERFRIDAPE